MEETETTIHNELVRCNNFLGENPRIRQVLNRREKSVKVTHVGITPGLGGWKIRDESAGILLPMTEQDLERTVRTCPLNW